MWNSVRNALMKHYTSVKQEKLKAILKNYEKNFKNIDPQILLGIITQIIEDFLEIKKVTCLQDFSFLLNNMILLKPEGWKSLHYRGENKKFKHPSTASYFRHNQIKNPEYEISEITKFKKSNLGKKIQKRFSDLNIPSDHYYWWYLTQHHSEVGKEFENSYFQTRLLDVSKNPYVALFFSCYHNNKESPEDGYVYIFDDLNITKINRRPIGSGINDKRRQWDKNPYTTYKEYIRDPQGQFDTDRLVSIDTQNLPQAYDLVKRVVAQSGDFYVQTIKKKSFYVWEFEIDKNYKQKILDDLSKYLNINSQTLLLDS